MAEREMFREPVTAIVLVLMTTSLLTCTVSSQPYKAIFKSEADSLAFNQLDTTVNVIPETIELGPEDSVGENFTIAVTVENVTDLAGLDITYHSCNALYEQTKDPVFACPTLLRNMVTAGYLGRKTGKGFYDYPEWQ